MNKLFCLFEVMQTSVQLITCHLNLKKQKRNQKKNDLVRLSPAMSSQ